MVVIPTYNHARPLQGVLARVAALNLPMVVVDDGSTDGTEGLLETWVQGNADMGGRAVVIRHARNRGKAAALRTGFERASAMGATHAATIDADGQLDPEDIPKLLHEAARHPGALILGKRPDRMVGCPARCAVGRRNASLALLAETGLRLGDTQCGLRVYPLALIEAVRCSAACYAFEAEVITRAVWGGYEVREVPIACRYFAFSDRVTHFKPWRDSLRQGAVHLKLLGLAMVRTSPRARTTKESSTFTQRCRSLLQWLNPMRSWREVQDESIGDLELASGLAIGAWIGTLPFYGLHTVLSVFIAWRLHLHPAAVVLGSQVSIPPFGIALAVVSIGMGHFLLTGSLPHVEVDSLTWSSAWQVPLHAFAEWLLGSAIVGIGVGACAYFIGLWIARRARGRSRSVELP